MTDGTHRSEPARHWAWDHGGADRRRGLSGVLHHDRWGIAAVSVVLAALLVLAMVGSLASDRSAARAYRLVELNAGYQKAATGVAAEESLERKYRLEPGPIPFAAHLAARRQVLDGLEQVRRLGNAGDRDLQSRLATEHRGYIAAVTVMFAAVDRHESAAVVNDIDGRTVDPVFGTMQNAIYSAAARRETEALDRVAATSHTSHLVLGLDAAIFLTAVALIVATSLSVTRSQRRLRSQSEINRFQALHDTLTGLPNRALFQDRTTQALRAASRSGHEVAVMLVDLDRFKDVNDTLGHHFGDLLLTQIAQRFAGTVRAGDSVARLGGDEFAVLLSDTTLDEAVTAAKRLTEVLRQSFTIRDISLDVEASVGIALVGPDSDVDTALRHADVAMYEAKGQHVAYAIYELTRDDNTVARLGLLGDLRRAISSGELVLYFQPKVTAATGELHSVEALVRWQHPTRGLLLPAEFVPIAEGTAVIHPLTDEVLRLALIQARVWRERGREIPISVNISARSLHDLAFPSRVQRQLDAFGVPASGLILELTEGAIMTDPGRAISALRELDAMGVVLSIDDFGTGYSSMSYLKDLPVRELKIDRSFVIGMRENEGDVVLVRSAVDLGHNLGLHVVAEGVEDGATNAALTAMGCDLVQGFYIRRPTTAVELDQWLDSRSSASPNLV